MWLFRCIVRHDSATKYFNAEHWRTIAGILIGVVIVISLQQFYG